MTRDAESNALAALQLCLEQIQERSTVHNAMLREFAARLARTLTNRSGDSRTSLCYGEDERRVGGSQNSDVYHGHR